MPVFRDKAGQLPLFIQSDEPVRQFVGSYDFLSNFYEQLEDDGITVEHQYQAAKCADRSERRWVMSSSTPGVAKSRGRKVQLVRNWDEVKVEVMLTLLRDKFRVGTALALRLDQTGDRLLQEGNTWGDTFWGISLKTGKGQNHLGLLLMQVREENRG